MPAEWHRGADAIEESGSGAEAGEGAPLVLREHGADEIFEAELVREGDFALYACVVEVSGGTGEAGVGDDLLQLRRGMVVGDGVELDLGEADLVDLVKDSGEILDGLASHHEELHAVVHGAGNAEGVGAEDAAGRSGHGRETEETAAIERCVIRHGYTSSFGCGSLRAVTYLRLPWDACR